MVNVFAKFTDLFLKFTDLFGWTNSNVWIEIAKKNNGKYIQGNIIKPTSLCFKYNSLDIIFDTFRRANDERGINTRIIINLNSNSNFKFKIRIKNSIYTPFVFFNRMKRINIKNNITDKYIVVSNEENTIINLLKDNIIKDINKIDLFCIELKTLARKNKKQLYIEYNGVINDMDEFNVLYDLCISLIDNISYKKEPC